MVTMRNKTKALSLNQLKEVITELSQSKHRQNIISLENGLPF